MKPDRVVQVRAKPSQCNPEWQFSLRALRYRRAPRGDNERCGGFPVDGFEVAGSRGKGLGAVIGLGVLESVVCEDTMSTWGPVVGDEKTDRFRADTSGGGGRLIDVMW